MSRPELCLPAHLPTDTFLASGPQDAKQQDPKLFFFLPGQLALWAPLAIYHMGGVPLISPLYRLCIYNLYTSLDNTLSEEMDEMQWQARSALEILNISGGACLSDSWPHKMSTATPHP